MDRDELIQFLKDNLRVEMERGQGGDYYSTSTRIRVKLYLGSEVISEAYEDVVEGKSDPGW